MRLGSRRRPRSGAASTGNPPASSTGDLVDESGLAGAREAQLDRAPRRVRASRGRPRRRSTRERRVRRRSTSGGSRTRSAWGLLGSTPRASMRTRWPRCARPVVAASLLRRSRSRRARGPLAASRDVAGGHHQGCSARGVGIARDQGKPHHGYDRRRSAMDQSRIRNFSIIAHIDHGKSTLADRILQLTETVCEREMRDQLLDSMELERERGITIKAQAVRVHWKGHELNLIDTPGHVDFTYEVSRSLQACEGAVLVVDAAQGIEAQTVANAYLAIENDLESSRSSTRSTCRRRPRRAAAEVVELLGGDAGRRPAHLGEDRDRRRAGARRDRRADPAPEGDADAPAARSSSTRRYDEYRGVIAYVRVVDGRLPTGAALARDGAGHRVRRRGARGPAAERVPVEALEAGEVGYVVTGTQGRLAAARRRHAATRRPRARAAARLPGGEADGLRGALPDGLERLPGAARGAREARAERRRALLRARDVEALGFGSAAGSSASSTWRSSESASSASSTSTSS